MRRTSARAFTLVELLVVIGIIALLISILLPSLNRARASAKLVSCQSQLRQIYQALAIYAANNKGFAPYGDVRVKDEGGALTPLPANEQWWWTDTISMMLGTASSATAPNRVDKAHPVFRDQDTVEPTSPTAYESHYGGNYRLFAVPSQGDPATGYTKNYRIRKLQSLNRASEIMVVWDAGQKLDWDGRADAVSWGLDNWQMGWGHGYGYPNPVQGFSMNPYDTPITLGDVSAGDNSKLGLQLANVDRGSAFDSWKGPYMRFRHMQNSTGNFCFGDGHVESRKLGEVLVKDICMNIQN
jgi:prepilin-type N-terminal cleavage/methylation domain-containing protein/prepilin-type processing-associated H-X9-DG protein